MNRIELLIILAGLLSLVIWFLNSRRFDRFLNRLIGPKPETTEEIKTSLEEIEKRNAALEKAKQARKKELEREHKQLEELDKTNKS